jgi:hypothetical protein
MKTLEQLKEEYTKRLIVPIEGSTNIQLVTKSGFPFCPAGYNRIVIGERGPYVEFEDVYMHSVHIPEDQEYRTNCTFSKVYYIEHRTIDESNVKIYEQLRTVNYADYLIGKFYVSPFDLKIMDGPNLIESIKK